ncbi:TetR/AcrR family transcriptional regulator, partial [Streptomyces sp. SID8455]|nr:TetR/AcrR family transcriptional regulator [Streptomyces sp. SID8455]
IVAELMRQWQERIADGIRALRARELIPASVDVDRSAAALLAGVQGGVSIMMSTGSSAHLRAALDTGIEQLRSAKAVAERS